MFLIDCLRLGISVNPNDYSMGHLGVSGEFFPQAATWYYISTVYSSTDSYVKLRVDGVLGLTMTASDSGSRSFIPATLDSPRIGSWLDPSGNIARSMHGEISVFRTYMYTPRDSHHRNLRTFLESQDVF